MDTTETKPNETLITSQTDKEVDPDVFLYIPNILDYLRVVFAVIGFSVGKSYPIFFLITYFVSFSLDLFDGLAARHFNQCSRLGGTLDMVIDRISTAGLLMLLSQLYPDYSVIFIYLMMLDIGSHWLQTHSAMMGDNLKTHINHKSLQENFFTVRLYYTNRYFLFSVCLFAEIFLLLIYLKHFYHVVFASSWLIWLFVYFTFGVYALKQYISVIQMLSAAQRIVSMDIREYHEKRLQKGN
jgi:CDP-diacylglycerol--inositol 3-phosphatidyltransferase